MTLHRKMSIVQTYAHMRVFFLVFVVVCFLRSVRSNFRTLSVFLTQHYGHHRLQICNGKQTNKQKMLCMHLLLRIIYTSRKLHLCYPPLRRTANAEIKVPSVENPELRSSHFKALSGSLLQQCMLHLLPGIFVKSFWSIHLHFLQNLSQVFPVLNVVNNGSCVGPRNINTLQNMYYCVSGLAF